MKSQKQLKLLNQGVDTWNLWRKENPDVQPNLNKAALHGKELSGIDFSETDLSETVLSGSNLNGANLSKANLSKADLRFAIFEDADLSGADLRKADLKGANFKRTNLSSTDLREAVFQGIQLAKANLSGANLMEVNLSGANLIGVNLSRANLGGADLRRANLREANLDGADLREVNLNMAILIKTNLKDANLTNCAIYGISAWDVQLQGATQLSLIITASDQPAITVDNLEVAQFIYLLLSNEKIRSVIDTITSKVILILGRFTPERKAILEAIREALRTQGYLPVLFDFDKPVSRDLTETVSTLAHLARFIIVDLTDPSSAPHEVATVIPHTVVPVQPLLCLEPLMVDGKEVKRREYSMFEDLRRRYHWVLPTFHYQDAADLLASLPVQIITPAEQKARELMQPK